MDNIVSLAARSEGHEDSPAAISEATLLSSHAHPRLHVFPKDLCK